MSYSKDRFEQVMYQRAMLVPDGIDGAATRRLLLAAHRELALIRRDRFRAGAIERKLRSVAGEYEVQLAPLLTSLCVAMTGDRACLYILETMEELGKERVLQRLEHAVKELSVVA